MCGLFSSLFTVVVLIHTKRVHGEIYTCDIKNSNKNIIKSQCEFKDVVNENARAFAVKLCGLVIITIDLFYEAIRDRCEGQVNVYIKDYVSHLHDLNWSVFCQNIKLFTYAFSFFFVPCFKNISLKLGKKS